MAEDWSERKVGQRVGGAAPSASGESPDDLVAVVAPDGSAGTVRRAELPQKLRVGFQVETEAQTRRRVLEKEHGDENALTFAEGAARTITFGATDALATDRGAREMRERREVNDTSGLLGEVTGAVLPGAGTLASGAGRAAAGGARAAGAGRVGQAVAGGTAEGALFGAGQGVSELGLSEDAVTAERVLSTIGSNTLFGAAFGGAAGGVAGGLAEGARAAKKGAGKVVEKFAAQADAGAASARLSDDVLTLDRKGLKAARESEVSRLAAEREAAIPADSVLRKDRSALTAERKVAAEEARVAVRKEGEGVIGELKQYVEETRPLFAKAEGSQMIGGLGASKKRLMRTLDDPRGWVESPWAAHGTATALRKQESILVDALASPKLALDDTARATAETWLAKNRAAQGRIKGFTEGLKNPTSPKLAELDDALTTYAERQAAARVAPTSARLSELDDAVSTLAERQRPGLMERLGKATLGGSLGGAAMGVGLPPTAAFFLGNAAAEATVDAVLARLGKRVAKSASGAKAATGAAVERFFGAAERGAKAAWPTATKALNATQFATPEQVKARPPRPTAPTKNPRVKLYRERAAELAAVVDYDLDGRPRMSMSAMKQMGDRLAGVAAVAPKLADLLVVGAARKLEFLASKLPKRQGAPAMPVGPDSWQPSEMDIAKFARFVDAAESPAGVLERMADGRMTPEDAEALKVVYPETYAETQQAIMERLPELRATLPYKKRLMLSVFFDRPVDPAMDPAVMGLLQGNYQTEPGTEGGVQAPPAKFASLRGNNPPQPTPGQRMSG